MNDNHGYIARLQFRIALTLARWSDIIEPLNEALLDSATTGSISFLFIGVLVAVAHRLRQDDESDDDQG